MDGTERGVLPAVARAAAELTGGSEAAVIALRGEAMIVLAVAGARARRTVGERLSAGDDTLSFVVAAGQSLSVVPAGGVGIAGTPAGGPDGSGGASLCLPCFGGDGVVGALELRGRPGAGPFGVAATRAAALLAEVAAAELADPGDGRAAAPLPPGELASELAQLAVSDPVRYRAIAWALEALLAGG